MFYMHRLFHGFLFMVALVVIGCSGGTTTDAAGTQADGLTIDLTTGVPYAFTFQFPIAGFDTSDFGFGFGSINTNFCLASGPSGCTVYGAHTGRDTIVGRTPINTEVLAPADGIVRLTTTQRYGAFGSDSSANANYDGCLIALEHEFANGQGVTTVLGHVACESGTPYDASARKGNPPVGTLVRRGQYLAHVTHYWHGGTQTIDWHHTHWGMRRGAFSQTDVGSVIKGYVPRSEFTLDQTTHALTHPQYLDPFVIVAANGDSATQAGNGIRHHPSGTLLEDANGGYWLVKDATTIASVAPEVIASDRYDVTTAVKASSDEMGCYAKASAVPSQGSVTLYQRTGTPTIVMAYDATRTRYDVIRWEALVSWGFDAGDVTNDLSKTVFRETMYVNKGFRLLRPGTLVKADESSEVSAVTMQGTRVPIATDDVFEALGFRWERVVSIPGSVIDQVAGSRALPMIDLASIKSCAVSPACPSGGNCGGGGVPDVDSGTPEVSVPEAGASLVEICNGKDDNNNGQIDEIFLCKLGATDGPPCVSSCNTSGSRACDGPMCSWGSCKPFPESCDNGLDDDCNGKTDCEDPACASADVCRPKLVPVQDAGSVSGAASVHLAYRGPSSAGAILLQAWWQPPNAAPRAWSTVAECVDASPGDGILDCTFGLPHGSTSFEFQIDLPNGAFWGDESCSALGGCGTLIGTATLTADTAPLTVKLVPNNIEGKSYMNGHVDRIP